MWAEKVSYHHRLKWISLLADFQVSILSWSVAEVSDGVAEVTGGKKNVPTLLTCASAMKRKFHVNISQTASGSTQSTCLAASNMEGVSLRMSSSWQ